MPKEEPQKNSPFFSRTEIGAILHMSQSSVDFAIRRKQIPSVKVGRRILIPKVFVERAVAQALNNAEAPEPEAIA